VPREVPWWPWSVGSAIVADVARKRAVERHERVVTLWQRPDVTGR
jgi:hypothetical protein